MAVLKALRRTPDALRRSPVLFAPVLVILLFQVPQLVLQTIDPLLASVISLGLSLLFVFAMPFFQAGIVGMADEALDGRTSLDRFLHEGRSNYVSVLVAYLLLVAVNFVIGFVVFFVAIFGGIAFFGDVGGGANLTVLGTVGVIAAVLVLVYLLFVFFIQFYAQAIVIDGFGAVAGIKHSASVVRRHLASTLGYTLLVAALGGVAGLVFAVAGLLASPRSTTALPLPELSLAGTVGVAVLVVLLGTLFGGFFAVYSVAFYRTLDPCVDDGTG
jgi:hypothetical protein